jgi:hypothetical protein
MILASPKIIDRCGINDLNKNNIFLITCRYIHMKDEHKVMALFAVAILLLLVALYVHIKSDPEMFDGIPYAYGASSAFKGWADYGQSGSTRGAWNRKQQEFSMPRQGDVETVSAMQVKAIEDSINPRGLYTENLTASRGEPDFWEVPDSLRTAQSNTVSGYQEHLTSAPEGIIGGNNTFPWKDADAYLYPMTY